MKAILKAHFYSSARDNKRFEEAVDVEFRELDDAEAPLAVESADATTRWFQGRHYRRYALNGTMTTDPAFETDASKIVAYLQDNERPYPRGYMADGYPNERQPNQGTLISGYYDASTKSDDRKFDPKRHPDLVDDPRRLSQVDGVARFGRDCIVVDGMFWVACAEPKLVLDHGRIFVDTRHRTMPQPKGQRERLEPGNMNVTVASLRLAAGSFRMDEHAEVLALAAEQGSRAVPPAFVLHLPQSLTWDRRGDHLAWAGKLMLHHWSGDLAGINPDIGSALFEVARCYWNRDPDDIDLDALSDAIQAVISAHKTHLIELPFVERITDDWNQRPIETERTADARRMPGL